MSTNTVIISLSVLLVGGAGMLIFSGTRNNTSDGYASPISVVSNSQSVDVANATLESMNKKMEDTKIIGHSDADSVQPVVRHGDSTQGDSNNLPLQMDKSEDQKEITETLGQEKENMTQKDSVSVGTYEPYSEEKMLSATGDVVLFFHASWCPSCRNLHKSLDQSRADLPVGITILQLDYDNSTELKQRYGVRQQHTLVQVDAQGQKIKMWSGGNDLRSITSQIQ